VILDAAGTLEDERAVYTSIGADNEADQNFYGWIAGSKNRVRSGESLGGMSPCTTGKCAGVRHVSKFRDMNGSLPKLPFARGKVISAGNAQG